METIVALVSVLLIGGFPGDSRSGEPTESVSVVTSNVWAQSAPQTVSRESRIWVQ